MIQRIELSDLADPALEVYRLPEVQLRRYFEPAEGLFIAESPKVIGRALDAGYEPVSMLIGREDAETAALLQRCEGIPVYTAAESVLTQLTGYHLTRGALCAPSSKTSSIRPMSVPSCVRRLPCRWKLCC